MTDETTTGKRIVLEHLILRHEGGYQCKVDALAAAIDAAIERAKAAGRSIMQSYVDEARRQRDAALERALRAERDRNEWRRIAEREGWDVGTAATLRDANDRAEKAERERDIALEQLSKWRATVRRFLGDA